jgi:hypothetical protein
MPYIIAVFVLSVLILLLYLKVEIVILYEDDFSFKLKYCFITYRIKTKELGKNKKEKQKVSEKQKIKFFLQNFENIFELTKKLFKDISDKLCIELLEINLTICENDAAETAILYGVSNSIIYPVVSFLSNFVKIKKKQIQINPLFFDGNSNVQFKCIVSMRLCSIIWITIKRLSGFIISVIKDRQIKNKSEGSAVK